MAPGAEVAPLRPNSFGKAAAGATVAILIATKRVKNGWLPWAAVPVVAVVWYLALVALFVAYYMWNIRGRALVDGQARLPMLARRFASARCNRV